MSRNRCMPAVGLVILAVLGLLSAASISDHGWAAERQFSTADKARKNQPPSQTDSQDSLRSRLMNSAVPQNRTFDLEVAVSMAKVIRLDQDLLDLFIADSTIADVSTSSPRTLYVYGKKVGRTTLVGYGQDDTVTALINLRVTHDVEGLDQAIKDVVPQASVRIISSRNHLVLEGRVPSTQDADRIRQLASSFIAGGGVYDNMTVDMANQVNLRVRIAEVSRGANDALGINWHISGAGGANWKIGTGRNIMGAGVGEGPNISDPPGGAGSVAFSYLNPGNLAVFSALDALESDGLATTLAEPNLTTLSGETANFLAGGRIPVPTPQAGGNAGAITVEYENYGVSLSFTPTVLGNGRMSIRLQAEVSELTDIGSVQSAGFKIPAFTTRNTETVIELASGESFAISGLIDNKSSSTVSQFPGLANVPILGALFRSQTFKRNESELVVIVSPVLVRPASSRDFARLPTDDLVLAGRLERLFTGNLIHDGRPLPTSDLPKESILQPAPFRRLGGFILD